MKNKQETSLMISLVRLPLTRTLVYGPGIEHWTSSAVGSKTRNEQWTSHVQVP
jgi:hypothetical protein